MSKKSRRRNRRLLMMAALAGGAALAGRGKGTAFPRPDAGTIDQMAADATPKTNYITKKADTAVVAPINKNKFRTRGRITDSAGNTIDSAGMTLNRRIPGAVAPPSILNPYRTQRTGLGPRRFSKGGRVKGCGVAKRGLGRAFTKAKK